MGRLRGRWGLLGGGSGGNTSIQCEGNQSSEIYYHFHVAGSAQHGIHVPTQPGEFEFFSPLSPCGHGVRVEVDWLTESVDGPSSFPQEGVMYVFAEGLEYLSCSCAG